MRPNRRVRGHLSAQDDSKSSLNDNQRLERASPFSLLWLIGLVNLKGRKRNN